MSDKHLTYFRLSEKEIHSPFFLMGKFFMARAFSLSWNILFLKKVFIVFRVYEHLSASLLVTDIVINISNNPSVSLKVSSKLL